MPILTSEQLKSKFSDKQRPNGDDFADLIDTCANTGYTGNITIGNSTFTIANGIITNIAVTDANQSSVEVEDTSTPAVQDLEIDTTSDDVQSILLTTGTGYDGTYVHEDKVFPDPDVIKVYVNHASRNRFISYTAKDGKVYWELVKRGWFGTVSCLLDQPGICSGMKSKPFDNFIDLTSLKGTWREFFNDGDVRPNIRNAWNIN